MKTTEVIAALQAQVEEHGDLDFGVIYQEDGSVNEVEYIGTYRAHWAFGTKFKDYIVVNDD